MEKARNLQKSVWKVMVLTLLLLALCPVMKAKADNAIYIKNGGKENVVMTKSYKKYGYLIFFENFDTTKLKNIKVSTNNTKIATAKYKSQLLRVYPKKAGTVKVTLTGKSKTTGKNVKRTCTLKIVNFQNPFTQLKIGGKSYLSKIDDTSNVISKKISPSKVKFNYKLRSGWKITECNAKIYSNNSSKKIILKNGKTYNIKKGEALRVVMELTNKKQGVSILTDVELRTVDFD